MHDFSYQWCRLSDLNALQVHQLLQARTSVFVLEQQCIYLDADAYDLVAWHLIVWADDKVAAYLRVIDPGEKYAEASIGRVLTRSEFRGTGLGRQLMVEGLQRLFAQFPGTNVRISAQAYLQRFYESFGFAVSSAPYLEDDILHVEMLLIQPQK